MNGAMMFDVKNIAPMFKLEMGLPGNSFAFELARKMGMPEEVIKDAEARAGEEFVGIERNLRKIARNRKALDEKLERIRHTDKTLENITEKYQKELQQIRQTKKEILDQAKKEAEEIIKSANRQVENTIRTIKESQAEKETTQEARKELSGFMSLLAAKKEQQQKDKEDYIERKIKQLDARKERQKQRKAQKADERGGTGPRTGGRATSSGCIQKRTAEGRRKGARKGEWHGGRGCQGVRKGRRGGHRQHKQQDAARQGGENYVE